MLIKLPGLFRGLARPQVDEGLLAGPAEEAIEAIGVATPVLSLFQTNLAASCPDLAHEAQLSVCRRN